MGRTPVRAGLLTLALLAGGAALAALALVVGVGGGGATDVDAAAIVERAQAPPEPGSGDPLAYSPGESERLAQRAALGVSHVIYAKSPGGVSASAERTAAWREQIERAAGAHGADADTLEALVFLESAGRPEVMADGTPHSATGLTQIIPSTATDLLGMQVDVDASARLTRAISRAAAAGRANHVRRLSQRRARIDERFDPARALEGAARYLEIARERFGSEELAVVSYHMGIGNLESVIEAYTGEETGAARTAELVDELGLEYARLFFDSSPQRNAGAWRLLSGFGDDSSLYPWRIRASREIMRSWRRDPEELSRFARLATAKATLEEVFHPEEETEVFEEPSDVQQALDDGELVELPRDRSLGFVVGPQAGELAGRLDVEPELYHALRPEALAALSYMAGKVAAISGETRPLRVTSAVRDRLYQELLRGVNPEATAGYSLHTTGWSFDILRDYGSEEQARAFQFVLDRMRAHALIDYAYEPAAIHITASGFARELVE